MNLTLLKNRCVRDTKPHLTNFTAFDRKRNKFFRPAFKFFVNPDRNPAENQVIAIFIVIIITFNPGYFPNQNMSSIFHVLDCLISQALKGQEKNKDKKQNRQLFHGTSSLLNFTIFQSAR